MAKQYTVSEATSSSSRKLNAEAESTVKFDQVLAVLDGENSKVGTPVVEGASVEAKVVKNGKGKKITILRYKAKKNERRRRSVTVSLYTKVEITKNRSVIMTRCEFFTEDERITGFTVFGHSGYAEAGSDIVCAAVSTRCYHGRSRHQ